ncbi:MAG: carboxypeptidase, partial [Armatimonadota bacterium]
REEAEHLGYTESIYDALLDLYEQGTTAADARTMFDALKGPQVELVKAISEQPETDDALLYGNWPNDKQRNFTESIVRAIGFDFNRGRQDTAPHPFCTTFSTGDVRLTTRYKDYLGSAIFGSLHEAGHGMYEQGSPMEWDRTPLQGGVSLGLHESQSRTWENIVGRSRPFWSHFLPQLQATFPEVGGVKLDDFYKSINKVRPTLIRVEADELTYNLHVMIRFEIELAVLENRLSVKEMPAAWNAKYEEYLGITPPNDSVGCLQDVHWSMGSIGYFPAYTIGNVLSYQIWRKLQADLGDTDALIAEGKFAPILGWLQEKVYRKGRSVEPKKLIEDVTGEPMNTTYYLEGLGAKYRDIYGL